MTESSFRRGFWLQSRAALLAVVCAIILINGAIFNYSQSHPMRHDIQVSKYGTGFWIGKMQKFLYFYYYTGHFPLATLNEELEFSEAGAYSEIAENGENLIMEHNHVIRVGENARIFAFLPDALLKGSPEKPSIKLFNVLTFVIAMIALYIGFWRANQAAMGLLLAAMVNITPFFIYQIYYRENIFGLGGALFFLILGLNAGLLFTKPDKTTWPIVTALISAVIIGFYSEVRTELTVVLGSLLAIVHIHTSPTSDNQTAVRGSLHSRIHREQTGDQIVLR